MKKIAQFSVNYPTTILMMVLAVILLGYISFQRLGIDLLPKMESPRLFIEISAGERPPEEMERQLVTNLEAVAARGRMVKNVSSIIRVGKALVTVEYDWQADMDEAYLDLQKGMADFTQGNNNIEVNVSQHDPNATAMITAILSHPEIDDLDLLRRTAENVIRNELIRLPGVAAVELLGAQTRELEIKVDPFTLQAYGLTVDRLAAVIQNANRNMTGGSIVEMGIRYVIRGVSEFETIEDINNLIVTYKMPTGQGNPDGSNSAARTPIYLREVADVKYVLSDPINIVHLNGNKCLALEIYKEARFNTIEASQTARDELDKLRRSLAGYNIEIISDQSGFIQAAITEVEQAGLVGIFLAVIVLFVFLRRFGVTMVVSLAVPISIIATFNLMYFNGLTLNVMTLGGLALGAGMLVDNAIVVVENIFRHIEAGKSVKEASILGAGEVGGAITASTLTTVVVFLPIVYLHGAAGELFREQAWTVAFSLVASLFAALSVIPMLASKLIKPNPTSNTKSKITSGIKFSNYGRWLESIIEHRKAVVMVAGATVIATFLIIPLVGSEFMPQTEKSDLLIRLTLPEGSDLSRTEGVVKSIEAIISENFASSFTNVYSRIGPVESSGEELESLADENSAIIYLILDREIDQSGQHLIAQLGRSIGDIPDLETKIEKQQTVLKSTMGTATAPMVIEIKGENLDILSSLSLEIKSRLEQLESLSNVETSFQDGRPEINVEIDRIQAAQYSLSAQTISSQLRDLLSGREAGQVKYQGEYSDIKLNRPEVTVDELSHTLLETSDGRMVRLDEVARLKYSTSPKEITRNNQTRVGRVTAHIVGDESFDKTADKVRQAISTINLPPEYSLDITGEEALRKESFSNLKFALMLAIILVYMVMAAQFESLLHPFVILLTIPLAGVGAVLLLLILGLPFNIMSFIGIIMLAGIAVNDSIILIDRINQNRRSGMPLTKAVVDAGRMRIRPIIMTSITTILALAPLTIGLGEGAALRAPMAVAVIGGLFSSTALTLIVIPAAYHLLAGKVAISPLDDQQAQA